MMSVEIRISDPATDGEGIDHLTRNLRNELMVFDIDASSSPSSKLSPAGARGAEVVATGVLIVQAAIESGFLSKIVDIVGSWKARQDVAEVEIVVGPNRLTLRNAAPDQQRKLVEHFIRTTSKEQGVT
jgi:hypothetical protein